MNIKLITLTAAMAMTTALAQENSSDSANEFGDENAVPAPIAEAPAPVAEAPAPAKTPAPEATPVAEAPAPVAEAPAPVAEAPAGSSPFDVLHANVYNSVGNQAAASTIGGNVATPYMMAGSKLIYLEPTNANATLAFGDGMTKFIDFKRGLATLGIATPSFGLSVGAQIEKEWTFQEITGNDAKTTYDRSNVGAGDLIEATFAAPLGGIDLTINAAWQTSNDEVGSKTEKTSLENGKQTTEIDQDYWNITGSLTISNTPSSTDFAWAVGVTVSRHELYTETKYTDSDNPDENEDSKITSPDAYLSITPNFNMGARILSTANAQVFIGLNTYVPLTFYDEIKDTTNKTQDNYHKFSVFTMPNILAELALSDNWLVFGQAYYSWNVFSMKQNEFQNHTNDIDNKTKTETSIISTETGSTLVEAGTRFQYKNFALEASIATKFYSDPLCGFNGDAMIASLGGFINF